MRVDARSRPVHVWAHTVLGVDARQKSVEAFTLSASCIGENKLSLNNLKK